jgi:hypothetical protein
MDNLTICAWLKPQQNPGHNSNVVIVDKDCYTAYRFHIYDVDPTDGKGVLTSWINGTACGPTPDVELEMSGSIWYHVVLVYDNNDNEVRYYVDGSLAGIKTLMSEAIGTNSAPLRIGRSNHPTPQYFKGIIDDVRVYDRVLSSTEIYEIFYEGLGAKAYNPNPADGAVNVDPNVVLIWLPGEGAISHDVYLGTDFNDVNDANTSSYVYMGNQDSNSWDPCGLELETTYFWRIDELGSSDTCRGDVWGFTTVAEPNLLLGLVSHWKFDEGEGSTAYDSTGDNHGTIYGTQWTTGMLLGALDFNGLDDYVDAGDSSDLEGMDGMDNLTICAWLKPQQNPGHNSNVVIVDKDCYTAYRFHIHDVDQTDGKGALTSWINGISGSPTTEIEIDMTGAVWCHAVLVYSNIDDEVRYYVNGSLAGAKTIEGGAIGENSASLRISRSTHPDPQFLRGIVDDVRIYDRALSAAEIEQLYQEPF